MHKVFITGANGFIGNHLCRFLAQNNISFSAGVRRSCGLLNEVVYGDITEQTDWPIILKNHDVVVHLAAKVHSSHSDNSEDYYKQNIEATLKLAEKAKSSGIKKFIFISSVKVNGDDSKDTAFTPDAKPNPTDLYGKSKLEAELQLSKLHDSNFEVIIIRPPLVYGPGAKANISLLIQLVKLRIPLPLDYKQNQRSLVSVFNVCDFIFTCINSSKLDQCEIFFVADTNPYSLSEILINLAQSHKIKLRLFSVPFSTLLRLANFLGLKFYTQRLFGNLSVDISKNWQVLSWKPKYNFTNTYN